MSNETFMIESLTRDVVALLMEEMLSVVRVRLTRFLNLKQACFSKARHIFLTNSRTKRVYKWSNLTT